MISRIQNSKSLKHLLDTNYKVVTSFTTNKCTQSTSIGPFVESLARNNPEIRFAVIDVTEAGELAREFKIQSTPTFITFKNERRANRVVGSDQEDVRELVEELTRI